ncbi:MAG: acyl CoA:acetate/3-ketoacid CoA transferase, partial [Desulfobacula sp.]|nr:acyl CoA:acetate/3-ketoacid CoA transferase [Desulfobacula sp.]
MFKKKNKPGKIMSAVEALGLIKNGDTVTTSGFHGSCVAEDLIITLGEEYVKHQTPKDLTIVYCAG